MYLVARQGALERFKAHRRVPRAELDRHFSHSDRDLTVLVPSYAEEPEVVRATLWSAALQEYPSMRVMLLLDDPPYPTDPAVAERLDRSRRLAEEIETALEEPRFRADSALRDFESKYADRGWVEAPAVHTLAELYRWSAGWLRQRAEDEPIVDHVDVFFTEQVLGGLADDLELTASALDAAVLERSAPTAERMGELHRRLVWIFTASLGTFERKLYSSVSHEANKAMNLNAYLGLMGGHYRPEETPDGTILRPVDEPGPGDLCVPDADYVLTLDADSLLLREYCLRLVYLLEQPEHERVAVVQTPYSSFRGASTRIERLAGATTDLQHLLHQGMTKHNATFWVGANAVIRKAALADIVETETVGGFTVRRYVQDRTVIEDTESSIDLGSHGWTLVNYPERLSYSATPPDFGSLIVQRRRWANGGLLIMPKLWRQVRDRRRSGQHMGLLELALRVNYMASIAWASFGLVFLLAYPYDGRLLSPVVVLAALPYFIAMASDLRYCGYKRLDVLRIYGFNLILLPVNLAGVLKSIEQAITNRKIPFARTPKVRNRTAAPALYVLAPYLIIAFSLFTLWRDATAGNWGNALFAAFNAVLAIWITVAYIGIGTSMVDLFGGVLRWLFIAREPKQAPVAEAEASDDSLDWRAVLYHGRADEVVHRTSDLRIAPLAPAVSGAKS
ncbi:glycosyltransferase family 2 protein [Ruicaihuangia caeni]|uniref:Glycosyltransferase family 2 protein n=1 Tax=Ruicaihuangia caeni TaxID=3042517 RepID=A0AAW6T7V4_9MICO|nr:glycosyltransferase family 2 protein [Klugiella sp. YN-L-19]MDI2098168.1 glycosyltransferase family 2 protein [Klugiella sp. YN-L-19]